MSLTPCIEFKNKAMEKLWIYLSNHCMFVSADSTNAFIQCDEELADIQDQCEHWKTMYGNACGDQDVLKESIRLLDTENRRLMAENKDQKKEIEQRRKEEDGLYKTLDLLRYEKERLKQKVREQEKEYKSLQDLNLDIITKHNETLASAVSDKDNELQDLQKEHDELEKDCAYMTNSRDTWRSRAKHAEAEAEDLKKKLDLTQHAYNGACKDRNCKAEAVVELAKIRDQLQEALDNIRAELEAKVKRMDEITNDRDTYNSLYAELRKDYVKLSEENKKLKARTDCLREEVKWYRKHYKEQSDKIRELNKKLTEANDILKETDAKEEYEITFTMDKADCKELMKLLSNKAYGASPEYMKDFLQKVCDNHRSCLGCPLRFSNCNFNNISDEEIEEYYKMAISSK